MLVVGAAAGIFFAFRKWKAGTPQRKWAWAMLAGVALLFGLPMAMGVRMATSPSVRDTRDVEKAKDFKTVAVEAILTAYRGDQTLADAQFKGQIVAVQGSARMVSEHAALIESKTLSALNSPDWVECAWGEGVTVDPKFVAGQRVLRVKGKVQGLGEGTSGFRAVIMTGCDLLSLDFSLP